jgi:deoxycytidine triphosphate deaminase
MSQEITAIIVNNEIVEIRRDEEGRVNMNDLFKASGKGASKKPVHFFKNKKTKRLLSSLEETVRIPTVVSTEGRGGSTYAHEDVVLAYAAWIDADFYANVARTFGHAAVIEAFTALANNNVKKAKENYINRCSCCP